MKENYSNWRQSVSISNLSKLFLFGIVLAMSSFSFAQTNANTNAPIARMMLDNSVTIRTGLNESYTISIAHFGFASTQEAEAYFQAREVDYIDFVVLDKATVQMNLDVTNPSVANWTLNEWNQALVTRANNSTPRTLPQ